MAQVPKIDTPCPLGVDEQQRLNGYCRHCSTQVHALDGLDEARRRALLQAAPGPVCVSYRRPAPVPARRGAGFGIAIAATLVSSSAFAADPPMSLTPTSAETVASPVEATPLLPAAAVQSEDEMMLDRMVFVGGVSDPHDAQWVDDSELPDLPMRDAATLDEAAASTDASTDNPIARR